MKSKLLATAVLFMALAGPVFAQAKTNTSAAPVKQPVVTKTEAKPEVKAEPKPVATPLSDSDKVVILTTQRDQTAALLALQKTQEYQAFLQAERKLEVEGNTIAKKNGCTKGIDADLNCLK